MSGIDDEPTLPDGAGPLPDGDDQFPLVLGGRYTLEEQLGTGGAAAVWRAFDEGLARTVAVKVLRHGADAGPDAAARLQREAATAGRAAHPGIVAVYDAGIDEGVAWLALEHVAGPTLLEVLRHHPTGLPPQAAAAIAEQTAVALGHAHGRGLVHRDVKPSNLLLTSEGVVKLADFGVATTTDDGRLLEPAGSRGYAAPEQLRGGPGADRPPVDVFALGVLLHECLTGQPAFSRGRHSTELLSPRQVRPDVPRDLDAVVRRATRPEPAERYPDGAAMAAALRPLVASDPFELTAGLLPAVTRPATSPAPAASDAREPAGAPRRTLDWRWVVVAAAVLVGVGFLASLAATGGGGPRDEPTALADIGVPVARIELFDPYGSVGDEGTSPTAAIDGELDTAWRTPSYPVPLRSLGTPGLGLWLDTATARAVDTVEVALETGGITIELLSAPNPPGGGTTEADWTSHDRRVGPGSTVQLAADGAEARYWLLWITELEPVGETWQAAVQDIRFRPVGTP